jgi:hypothetical protein
MFSRPSRHIFSTSTKESYVTAYVRPSLMSSRAIKLLTTPRRQDMHSAPRANTESVTCMALSTIDAQSLLAAAGSSSSPSFRPHTCSRHSHASACKACCFSAWEPSSLSLFLSLSLSLSLSSSLALILTHNRTESHSLNQPHE